MQNDALEHITYWSDIWHYFDVIEKSTRSVEERGKTRELSPRKNLTRFTKGNVVETKKRHLPDSVGPKTRRRSCPPREK